MSLQLPKKCLQLSYGGWSVIQRTIAIAVATACDVNDTLLMWRLQYPCLENSVVKLCAEHQGCMCPSILLHQALKTTNESKFGP